jgi:hypothetical protein
MILTSECHSLGEDAITTYLNVLGLKRPAQVGLKLNTSWMLSESTRTNPLNPSSFPKRLQSGQFESTVDEKVLKKINENQLTQFFKRINC